MPWAPATSPVGSPEVAQRGKRVVATHATYVDEAGLAEEKIAAFLPVVDELVTEGLVTIEAVRVLKYASPDRR